MTSTGSGRRAMHRDAARVLLFNPSGHLLLMQGSNPSRPQAGRWWFPVGGGVEHGEDLATALARELREETGIEDLELGPLVWLRSADFPYLRDKHLYQREYYFVGWTRAHATRAAAFTEYEERQHLVLRWWDPAQLAHTPDTVVPAELPALIGAIRDGHFPAKPIELAPYHAT